MIVIVKINLLYMVCLLSGGHTPLHRLNVMLQIWVCTHFLSQKIMIILESVDSKRKSSFGHYILQNYVTWCKKHKALTTMCLVGDGI